MDAFHALQFTSLRTVGLRSSIQAGNWKVFVMTARAIMQYSSFLHFILPFENIAPEPARSPQTGKHSLN